MGVGVNVLVDDTVESSVLVAKGIGVRVVSVSEGAGVYVGVGL